MNLDRPPPCVIDDIANEVHRTAEHRLRTHRPQGRIETTITQNAHVAHRTVRFEAVVVNDRNIVIVDIDSHRQPVRGCVRIPVRHTVGRMVDPVVESSHAIVGDHMPRPIDRNSIKRLQLGTFFKVGTRRPRFDREPGKDIAQIFPADHVVVGNVETAGTGKVRVYGRTDILETGMLHRNTLRSGYILQAGFDGRVRIAEGDAFEVVVLCPHEVEKNGIAVSVEDHFPITCSNNRNRALLGAILRKVISTVPGRAATGGKA